MDRDGLTVSRPRHADTLAHCECICQRRKTKRPKDLNGRPCGRRYLRLCRYSSIILQLLYPTRAAAGRDSVETPAHFRNHLIGNFSAVKNSLTASYSTSPEAWCQATLPTNPTVCSPQRWWRWARGMHVSRRGAESCTMFLLPRSGARTERYLSYPLPLRSRAPFFRGV